MPGFIVDGVAHTTGEAKARCFRDSIWPDTSDDEPKLVSLPELDPRRPQYESLQALRRGEVKMLAEALKTGKAAGT